MNRKKICDAKQRILAEMEQYDPKSEEYAKLVQRLENLTKAENQQNDWKGRLGVGLLQTGITAITSFFTVKSILKHEDRGNVITTKSLNYVQKPK